MKVKSNRLCFDLHPINKSRNISPASASSTWPPSTAHLRELSHYNLRT